MLSVNVYGHTVKLDVDALQRFSKKSDLQRPDVELSDKTDLIRAAYNPLNVLRQLVCGTVIFSPWLCLSGVCENSTHASKEEMKKVLARALVYRLCYYNVQAGNPFSVIVQCPPLLLFLWVAVVLVFSPTIFVASLLCVVVSALTYLQIYMLENRRDALLENSEDWMNIFYVE